MRNMVSFLSGLLMALGLMFSGMANPRKVIGFLDVTGEFDPSLLFVMAGALLVAFLGFGFAKRAVKPMLCSQFDQITKTKIDAPLMIGAVIFGSGWGLAGFCPAPAIVSGVLGYEKSIIFVVAMIAGMFIAQRVRRA